MMDTGRKQPFPTSMTLLMMALLENQDLCGYQMIQELECHSEYTFSANEGMIYPILHDLEQNGEVRSYYAKAETGQLRKYYQLTKQGIHTLSHKKKKLEQLYAKMGRVLGGEACGHL